MTNRKVEDEKRQGSGQKAPEKVRNDVKPEQRIRRNASRGEMQVADWASCEGSAILAAVCAVTARGCAIQFGYTRDGSAYTIRVLGDGEPYTEYVRPSESLGAYLTALAADFTP
jgi:hypothetical protein